MRHSISKISAILDQFICALNQEKLHSCFILIFIDLSRFLDVFSETLNRNNTYPSNLLPMSIYNNIKQYSMIISPMCYSFMVFK